MENNEPATGTEAQVCADIARRQAFGRKKYGTTVAENPPSEEQWIQHAYEEALDLAVYLRRLLSEKRNEAIPGVPPPQVYPAQGAMSKSLALESMAAVVDTLSQGLPSNSGVVTLIALPEAPGVLEVSCMTNLSPESCRRVMEQFLDSHPAFTTDLPA